LNRYLRTTLDGVGLSFSVRPIRDARHAYNRLTHDKDSMGNDSVVIGIAWRKPMPRPMKELAEVERHVSTLYASLELSQSTWLVTSLSPGSVTMSKHSISAGDGAGLLGLHRARA
jgi:hypothetical protein